MIPEDEVRRALRGVRHRLGATAEIAKLVRQITEEVWPEEEAEAPVREEAAA